MGGLYDANTSDNVSFRLVQQRVQHEANDLCENERDWPASIAPQAALGDNREGAANMGRMDYVEAIEVMGASGWAFTPPRSTGFVVRHP